MKRLGLIVVVVLLAATVGIAFAADIVPTDVQQPGSQSGEVGNLEAPDKCDNCHGGYDQAVEPAFTWRGSMMANAGRDPLFWATLAVAEQDFDGAGDFCIRCHSTGGWYSDRSTPTDGSGLMAQDADGVDCDTCHSMTNPDNSEHLGVMNPPFVANDGQDGYFGSGILSLLAGSEKLGPYADTSARHQFAQSTFHRSQDYCGSCHDVSNPVVGDLAPGNGTQPTGDPVVASYVLGGPVEDKAAFNNFPYQYGVVERTFSEYYASLIPQTPVSAFSSLPADLQAGALAVAAAQGDYEDGTTRYFTCQTCHMPGVTGKGADKNGTPTRTDLPLHDLTGGNYWTPEAILYQETAGTLLLGGGLSQVQIDALNAGANRARNQLNLAASLEVTGDTLKVVNLTGHKLISGYPEGRRMWLNIQWFDSNDNLLREDGAYGDLTVTLDGSPTVVRTLLDLHDGNTTVYEAHYGITQEWAAVLVSLDPAYYSSIPLVYDRNTGETTLTLGELAAQSPGSSAETFHFVLNNTIVKDNRIPPYGFDYEEARVRNALPVPADQYGGGPGGTYNYWDEVSLDPPVGAAYAEIKLLYQPTSWEYIQFLYLANTGQSAFLADEGINLLEAWLNTNMAEPHTMASTTWVSSTPVDNPPTVSITSPTDGSTFAFGDTVSFAGSASDIEDGDLSAGLVWSSDLDGGIGTGPSFSKSDLSVGTHTITASVTDSGGNTTSASVSITVTPVSAGPLLVSVTTSQAVYAKNDTAVITVLVTDSSSVPVEGASVSLIVTTANGNTATASGTTDASGTFQYTMRINPKRDGVGTYTVDADAAFTGYDPGTGSTTFNVQ